MGYDRRKLDLMSKQIISPVKRFPGSVTLSDPLSYPQVFAWRDAIAKVEEFPDGSPFDVNAAIVPGILAIVEKWELDKFPTPVTMENFPATPPVSAARLVAWITGEITSLFSEAEEIPLE
jgi:hypothetical protein